jgi:hypothetical protein
MWKKIKEELKEKIPITEYDCWIKPIKEESFKNNILTLNVPNNYFFERFENKYKPQIKTVIKEKYNNNINIKFQITTSKIIYNENELPKQIITMKKKKFNGRPYFSDHIELNLCIKESNLQEKKNNQNIEKISMPNKYSVKDVATFSLFDSKFFTYPNDTRKKAKVKLDVRFDNGTIKTYDLYRGQLTPNDIGRGQLTTTHAKIFLAIVHMWQKQLCKYADSKGFYAVIDISVRELAKHLGYQKVSGADYRRLLSRIKELADSPVILSDKFESYTFTFLWSIIVRTFKKNKNNKSLLRITFNPFIAKQLYERKAFLRNPKSYKIKNPTAFKFLFCYDKKIIKGNKFKLKIRDVANNLEMATTNVTHIFTMLKTAFQELNGYELNDNYQLQVKLIKENKQYFVVAERMSKTKQVVQNPLALLQTNHI